MRQIPSMSSSFIGRMRTSAIAAECTFPLLGTCEDDHVHVGKLVREHARDRVPAERGKVRVQECDVRPQDPEKLQSAQAIIGLTDDLDVRSRRDGRAECASEFRVCVAHDDTYPRPRLPHRTHLITRIRSIPRRSSPTFEGHLRVARNVARSSSSCELRLPANAGMPPPPPATRAVIWSRVSRAATCERSGPLRLPLPSIWLRAQQLLVTKSSEPCVAGASSPAVTVDERPAPWSRGTHGDSSPAVVSAAYAMNGSATAAIASGRRDQCRSPSGHRIGTRNRNTNAKSGSPMMTTASVAGGISASKAK